MLHSSWHMLPASCFTLNALPRLHMHMHGIRIRIRTKLRTKLRTCTRPRLAYLHVPAIAFAFACACAHTHSPEHARALRSPIAIGAHALVHAHAYGAHMHMHTHASMRAYLRSGTGAFVCTLACAPMYLPVRSMPAHAMTLRRRRMRVASAYALFVCIRASAFAHTHIPP
jgi:hypothetical protein